MFKISARQDTFVSSQSIYDNIIPEDHILVLIQDQVDFTFINKMLEGTYCPDNGRPTSNYPSRMLKALFLSIKFNLSDRDMRDRANTDLVVKWFLEYNVDEQVFDFTALSDFRNRLGEEIAKEAFFKINQQIEAASLITPGESQTIDATHVKSKTAILTVPQMLYRGLVKLFQELKSASPNLEKEIKEQIGFEGDIAIKPNEYAMSDAEKEDRISRLVNMAQLAIDAIRQLPPDSFDAQHKVLIDKTAEVLQRIIAEQTDEMMDDKGKTHWKKKDKKDKPTDRIASPVDTDARHGHKTSKKPFTGYKVTITQNENEIITDVRADPGNMVDGDAQIPMFDELEQLQGKRPEKGIGDKAYGDGEVRRKQGEKGTQVVAPLKEKTCKTGKFSVENFEYNPDTSEVICPYGKSAKKIGHNKQANSTTYQVSTEDCLNCPLRQCCTSANARTINISDYEPEFRKANEYNDTEDYKLDMKRRSGHERKNSEMKKKHGMEKARYWGISKMRIQAYITAIVVNIKRFITLGKTVNKVNPVVN